MKPVSTPILLRAKITCLIAAMAALAGCNWIIPHYDERSAVLSSVPEPGWSHVTAMEECAGDPGLMRGSVHAPRGDRKLRGIGFVKTRLSQSGGPEVPGEIHWAPQPDFDFDGDLVSNRYFERLLQCDFGETGAIEPRESDICFGLYCPCEGDTTRRDEAGAAFLSSYDRYMCIATRSGPDHPLVMADPAGMEQAGLEMRAAYKTALEAASQPDLKAAAQAFPNAQ